MGIAKSDGPARIGLISDTHGRLDPRVHDLFRGVDAIIHAGDVCSASVLAELELIAPVTACRGNMDRSDHPGLRLPFRAGVTVAGVRFLVLHDLCDLGEIPEGVDVVVCGHTHRTRCEWHGRTLVVNPGSVSEARGDSGRNVALLEVAEDGELAFRVVPLPS